VLFSLTLGKRYRRVVMVARASVASISTLSAQFLLFCFVFFSLCILINRTLASAPIHHASFNMYLITNQDMNLTLSPPIHSLILLYSSALTSVQ
jgi:hypothetical protein